MAAVHMSIWPTSRDSSERRVGSSSTPSTDTSIGRVERLVVSRGGTVDDLADEPDVMLDHLVSKSMEVTSVSSRQTEAAGWMEMDAVGRLELDVAVRPLAPGRRPTPYARWNARVNASF